MLVFLFTPFTYMKICLKKNTYLFLLTSFLSFYCLAQTSDNYNFTDADFEKQILTYIPKKTILVSEGNYHKALSILDNTKKSIANDNNEFVVTDYWNITLALALLNESQENIELSFKKGIDANRETMCVYLNKIIVDSPTTRDIIVKAIPDLFSNFRKSCTINSKEEAFETPQKLVMNGEDQEIVKMMRNILDNDAKYRKNAKEYMANKQKQTLLDDENQKAIDSIYQVHQTYIGKSMVGEELSVTMWLVIQHSNLEMMKKYIPVIHEAVKNEELKTTPFKMLLDRVYAIEKGYQIFGSQGGVERASDSIRNAVIEKYQL